MDLVVTAEELARRARIPYPLDSDTAFLLTTVLTETQSDVQAYLGRPVMPVTVVERRCWPVGGGWRLREQPVLDVISEEPEIIDGQDSGYWTVTYTAGINARTDPEAAPIRRYIMAAALSTPDLAALTPVGVGRVVTSVSTEGQSITYGYDRKTGQAGTFTPGSIPPITSLDRWRRAGRRVYIRGGGAR